MFSSFSKFLLTFALAMNIDHVKGIMVKSIDGSFVPLSFVARAPGEGPAVQMINNHDLAYLVSSRHYIYALSTDEVIGNCSDGLAFVVVSPLGPTQS